MNLYSYLLNLAGYPAIFSTRYAVSSLIYGKSNPVSGRIPDIKKRPDYLAGRISGASLKKNTVTLAYFVPATETPLRANASLLSKLARIFFTSSWLTYQISCQHNHLMSGKMHRVNFVITAVLKILLSFKEPSFQKKKIK
jgi:hypothetical protein